MRTRLESCAGEERTLDRRALLGVAAGAGAAVALGSRGSVALGAWPQLLMPRGRIGIQLYTVRDQVSSVGFAAVFDRLAAIGYKEIEFAGYTQGTGPITIAQIRQLMDDRGLVGIGSHVSPSSSNIEQLLDEAEILGLPYLGISFVVPPNTTVAGWQQVADDFNTYGAAAAARGIGFYFHNHFQEFSFTEQPGVRGIDVLLAETDPKLVYWQLDIYWIHVGQYQFGQVPPFTFQPLDYVTPRRNRIPLFHVKDGKRNPASPFGYDIVDVGEGDIDFRTFFTTVGEKWKHHYGMEHDNAAQEEGGSFGSAERSYRYMRRLRAA
jgi:sugar phosphate isomerase/epimerase